MFSCSYAIEVWQGIAILMGMKLMHRGQSVQDTWHALDHGHCFVELQAVSRRRYGQHDFWQQDGAFGSRGTRLCLEVRLCPQEYVLCDKFVEECMQAMVSGVVVGELV